MIPADLIAVARQVAKGNRSGRPSQASLRRTVSTAYYALFHTVCRYAADWLIGNAGQQSHRESRRWALVYRTLDHIPIKKALINVANSQQYSPSFKKFAREFVAAQEKRHDADYNPFAQFNKSDVLQDITKAEHAINEFRNAPETDRREFIALRLFKER